MKAQARSTSLPCNTTPDVAKKEQRKCKTVEARIGNVLTVQMASADHGSTKGVLDNRRNGTDGEWKCKEKA